MQTNHQARASAGYGSIIVNPGDAHLYTGAAVAEAMPNLPYTMADLSKDADNGVTASGRMAVALTLTRNRNARVLSGTALASPIFAGVDNDLEPAHAAARKAKRRAKGKAQRTARKVNR